MYRKVKIVVCFYFSNERSIENEEDKSSDVILLDIFIKKTHASYQFVRAYRWYVLRREKNDLYV